MTKSISSPKFRRLCTAASVLALWTAASPVMAAIDAPALTPKPQTLEIHAGAFTVLDGAVIDLPSGDAGARAAAERLKDLVARTRVFGLVLGEGREARPGRISFVRRDGVAGGPEAYELDVGPNGAVVSASTDAGLYYGAETLWQLMSQETARVHAISIPVLHIHDAPRFAWRGVLLDSARHFQSQAEIERLIDEMAVHKLNVFHWHLTDDQGWRIEIRKYPRLTEIGAWRTPAGAAGRAVDPITKKPKAYGGFYTQEQIRQVVAYAAARHITVVPEIDMPGHASAAIAAYPEWGSNPNPPKSPPEDWGVLPNLYNPNEKTVAAMQDVLSEVMDLFPSRFIHVGGDEAVKAEWKASPDVQAQIKALGLKNEQELQAWFIGRMDSFLTAHGRRLMGWDEILEGGVAPGAAVMSWRGIDGAITAARAGHDTVLSPAPVLYLDNRQSDAADEPSGRGYVLDLKQVYGFDPAPASLTPAEQAHVLGLQANIWTEHIQTDDRVQHMAFPRAAAVAEIGWSPASGREFADFARRETVDIDRDRALEFGDAWSAFAPRLTADPDTAGKARLTLSNQSGVGQIRYTLDGSEPTPASPAFEKPIQAPAPVRVRARVFDGVRPVAPALDERVDFGQLHTRASQELKTCSDRVTLDLGQDPPGKGPRPAFAVDIMNPCWLWRDADLDGVKAISASVGTLPYNFAFATDNDKAFPSSAPGPALAAPTTKDGELEVRLDGCDGAPVAVLPLGPAASKSAVTTLPAAALKGVSGRHDLCFRFTGKDRDQLWVVSRIRLLEEAAKSERKPEGKLGDLFGRKGEERR